MNDDTKVLEKRVAELETQLKKVTILAADLGRQVQAAGRTQRIRVGNVVISNTEGIRMFNPANGNLVGEWQNDGDWATGYDLTDPDKTSMMVFSHDQTYNSETVGEGDVLLGSNSTGYANVKWDVSAKQLQFRGGVTTQAYIDTDGAVNFGAGAGELNSTGIVLSAASSGVADLNSYKFSDGTNVLGGVYMYTDTAGHYISLQANSIAAKTCAVIVEADAPANYAAYVQLTTNSIGLANPLTFTLYADADATPSAYADLAGASYLSITSADLRVGSGLYVGAINVDPAAGDIYCTGLISTDGGTTKWELGDVAAAPTPDVGITIMIGAKTYVLAAEGT